MASNDITGLNFCVEENWTHCFQELWDSPPAYVSWDLSEAGLVGGEGFIDKLSFLFDHLLMEGGESDLCLHFGDADSLIIFGVVINFF